MGCMCGVLLNQLMILESTRNVVGRVADRQRPRSLVVAGLEVYLRLPISFKACDFDRTFSGCVHNGSLNVDE